MSDKPETPAINEHNILLGEKGLVRSFLSRLEKVGKLDKPSENIVKLADTLGKGIETLFSIPLNLRLLPNAIYNVYKGTGSFSAKNRRLREMLRDEEKSKRKKAKEEKEKEEAAKAARKLNGEDKPRDPLTLEILRQRKTADTLKPAIVLNMSKMETDANALPDNNKRAFAAFLQTYFAWDPVNIDLWLGLFITDTVEQLKDKIMSNVHESFASIKAQLNTPENLSELLNILNILKAKVATIQLNTSTQPPTGGPANP